MEKTNLSFTSLIPVFFTILFLVPQARNRSFALEHEPDRTKAPSHLVDSTRAEKSVSGQKLTQQEENTPSIEYFTATPSSIYLGMDVLLTWSVKNATVIGITPGIGKATPMGSISVRPANSITYTLTAINNSRMVKQEVTVKVSPPPPPLPPPPSRSNGARPPAASRQNAFRKGEKILLRPAFAKNSAVLPGPAYDKLTELAGRLLQSPETHIEISGHTNNSGQRRHDTELSLLRAKAVRDFLNEKGVPNEQMSVRGAGSGEPVTRRKKRRAAAMNSRIEIKIIRLTAD